MTGPPNAVRERMPRYGPARYWFGDIVYLRIREEKQKGMVTGAMVRPCSVVYEVDWGGVMGTHYDFELTTEFVPDFGPSEGGEAVQ